LAPVVDIGSSSVLGSRICFDDPAVVSEQTQALSQLYREEGILPVYKHFPGIGSVNTDLHDEFATTEVGVETAQLYRDLLAGSGDGQGESATAQPSSQPQAVMATFVGVENQFAELPCALSDDCIGELASTYPETLIWSDALEMESAGYTAAGESRSLEERARAALQAGVHVLLFGPDVTAAELERVQDFLAQRAETDSSFRRALDAAVRQQLDFWPPSSTGLET
jgi:beta-N-acetylhexosaminidase